MPSDQIQIDLDGLEAFLSTLNSFNLKLSGDWEQLKGRWLSLRDTWRDPECERFLNAVGWQTVIRELERYLSTAQGYEHYLEQKATALRQYHGGLANRSTDATPASPSPSTAPTPAGATWQTHQAVLEKIKNNVPLTIGDLKILFSPISDLQTGTLVEQNIWVRQTIAAEAYRRNLQLDDLIMHEPTSLVGFIALCAAAIASYFRWKGYWKDPTG